MADNTTLNTGTAGDVIRDVDRDAAGIKTQVVMLDVGGIDTGDVEEIFVGEVKALVNDATQSYNLDEIQPLSMTSDGRLRVITVYVSYNLASWGDPEEFTDPLEFRTFTAW